MTQPTPEQIAKLPKWAQEHISNLEHRLKNVSDTLQRFQDTQTKSRIWTHEFTPHKQYDDKNYIQAREVMFHIRDTRSSEGQYISVSYRHDINDDELSIRSSFGRLVILPDVANGITITTK